MSKEHAPETVFWVVRHGQTRSNAIARFQGQLQVPLDDTGRAQASALRPWLEALDWDVAVSSDLARVTETAELALGPEFDKVTLDSGLRERHVGVLQGLNYYEALEEQPEALAAFKQGRPDDALAEGESLRDFDTRCLETLERLREAHEGRKVLVFSHGGVLRQWFKHIVGLPLDGPKRFSTVNTSLGELRHRRGRWTIQRWGMVDHLKEIDFLWH